MPELTDKQIKFAQEYLVDLNATQAAIRAGYSDKTAKSIGCENLTKPDLLDLITELRAKQIERTEISADKVLKEYAKVAFIDIREFYDENGRLKLPHDLSDAAAASLAGIDIDEIFGYNPESDSKEKIGETKKIKLHNKLGALDALGRHLGIFEKDNAQSKLILPSAINVSIVPPDEE